MSQSVGLSKLDMRRQINRLNRLDCNKAEYKTICQIIAKMIVGIPIVVGTTKSHELFFRVWKNPGHKLNLLSELCAPPAAKVTGFQRCNAPGNPMLYCASRRITALLESDVKQGDIVYISQWIGKTQLPVNKVLDVEHDEEFEHYLDDKSSMFYAYLDTLFTKRVPKDSQTITR